VATRTFPSQRQRRLGRRSETARSSAQIGELAFAAGIPLHELIPQASSLEDVFLELTAEET
jgi:hypothetical protein